GHVPHAEAGHHPVEAPVGEGQGEGIPLHPVDGGQFGLSRPQGGRLLPGHLQHAGGEVQAHHLPPGAHLPGREEGKVARAAADIEHPLTGLEARQLPEAPLPVAPNAASHDQVHPVVPAGDAVEEILNVARLLHPTSPHAGPYTSPPDRILPRRSPGPAAAWIDRKSTRLNSSHVKISYAVSCLKKKKNTHTDNS